MGGTTSKLKFLDREMLDEYVELTYLKKFEIIELLNKFSLLVQAETSEDILSRFVSFHKIVDEFPQLKENPFGDRILQIFASKENYLSFEDLLDLFSVMSKDCPSSVKASWAFRIFDFNGDNLIDAEDILCIINRLLKNHLNGIEEQEKDLIVRKLLEELDLEDSGQINQLAFEHGIGKLSEFSYSFSFNI